MLWLNDSITQDGKYVSIVEYYLNNQFPNEKFDIISVGLASETLSGLSENDHPFPRPCLLERLARTLDKVKPTTVVACYGINDGIHHPQSPERLAAFEDGVKKLSAMTRAAGAELILHTPPPFDALPVRNRLRKADAADFSYIAPFRD